MYQPPGQADDYDESESPQQPEPEARELALASETITEGSLNVFAHKTNVNTHSRIASLDPYEMADQPSICSYQYPLS